MSEDSSDLKFRSSALGDMFEDIAPDENEKDNEHLTANLQGLRAMGGGCDVMPASPAPMWGEERAVDQDDAAFLQGFAKASLGKDGFSGKDASWDSGFGSFAIAGSSAPSSLAASSKKSTSWESTSMGSMDFGSFAIPSSTGSSGMDFGSFAIPSSTSSVSMDSKPKLELQAMPLHVNKLTSFYTSYPATEVFDEMKHVFDETKGLDYELDEYSNKFSGVVRDGSSENSKFWFYLRVYQSPLAGEILVEMQKGGGCVLSFNSFYLQTIAKLAKMVSRRGTVAHGIDTGLAHFLAKAQAETSVCQQRPNQEFGSNESDGDCFLEMLRCGEMEMQRNGISTMCQNDVASVLEALRASEENVGVLMKSLQSSLQSDDDILVDDACALLGSISEAQDLRDDIVSNLLSAMFSRLACPDSADSCHSKRHLIKALADLCSSHSSAIKNLPESQHYVKTLQRLHADVKNKQVNGFGYDRKIHENLNITLQQMQIGV